MPGPRDDPPDHDYADVYSPEPHHQKPDEVGRKQHESGEEPEPDPAELLHPLFPSGGGGS